MNENNSSPLLQLTNMNSEIFTHKEKEKIGQKRCILRFSTANGLQDILFPSDILQSLTVIEHFL